MNTNLGLFQLENFYFSHIIIFQDESCMNMVPAEMCDAFKGGHGQWPDYICWQISLNCTSWEPCTVHILSE